MSLPPPLTAALERITGEKVTDAQRAGGGHINQAFSVLLGDGRRAFVKTRPDAPPGEYATEAAGLAWLGEPGALAVAGVIAVCDPGEAGPGPRLLALEWIEEGRLDAAGEEELGRGLARVHLSGAPAFGAAPPGAPAGAPLRLGAVVLPNDPLPDWPAFYAQRRLEPLARMALHRGALDREAARAIDAVCRRIGELAGPPEPPARLHGDLWSGNVLAGAGGRPHIIDPAAYGGHREVDLAMLSLFGDPGPTFRDAYAEVAPLAPGHEDREALWQLLPLLVHAVLFGGSYGPAAARAARRYAG